MAIALDKRIELIKEQIEKVDNNIAKETKRKNELLNKLENLENEKKAKEMKKLEVVLANNDMTMSELREMLKENGKGVLTDEEKVPRSD